LGIPQDGRVKRVYLDYSATTPVDPRVLEAMKPFFNDTFGNASSIHAFGRETRVALEESREVVARSLDAEVGEVFFTSGGTESDNHALKGVAFALRPKGKTHLITSKAEHHAVLYTCGFLEKLGFEVTYLPVDKYGRVDPDDVRRSITGRTSLVSIMHANNEVGTLNAIEDIAQIANEHGVLFHSDTVQSFGKIPLDVKKIGVDLLAISGHKIYGPKGIGGLYVRKGTPLENLLHGGGQERGKRAGTENVPLTAGLAKAVEICDQQRSDEMRRLGELRELLKSKLQERFDGLLVNTHPVYNMPNILSISFDSRRVEIDGEVLLLSLDLKGVAVSNGSACTSGSFEPSHVLLAMGRDERTASASLRFSLGRGNTEADIEYAVHALAEVVERNRRVIAQ
jgi:cysteine desulfurase